MKIILSLIGLLMALTAFGDRMYISTAVITDMNIGLPYTTNILVNGANIDTGSIPLGAMDSGFNTAFSSVQSSIAGLSPVAFSGSYSDLSNKPVVTNGTNGAQGIQGPPGATGATGPTGVTGATGATGSSGSNGVNGTNGINAGVTTTTNFSGYASGGWYSNRNDYVIFAHPRIIASLALLAGNVETHGWTCATPGGSAIVTNDWYSATSLLTTGQSPKTSLLIEVPPHWWFCVTNVAVTAGNSVTLSPNIQFTSQP